MKDNRKVLYGLVALALLLSVVGISVGFASLSQDLKIEGQAEVIPASWDIHFENLGTATPVGAGEEISTPVLTATLINNIDVKLTKPGDSVSYTFDVTNDGTIDAKYSTLVWGTPVITGTAIDSTAKTNDEQIVTNNVTYTLTHADGTALTADEALNAGDTVSLKLTIAYDEDAEAIPTAQVNINDIEATLTYVQK